MGNVISMTELVEAGIESYIKHSSCAYGPRLERAVCFLGRPDCLEITMRVWLYRMRDDC